MAKKTTTTRVFQLAKGLGVTSKDIIAKCQAEGIEGITNHMSAVSLGLSATVREWFGEGQSTTITAVETAAPVDIAKVRSKAKKKITKKAVANSTVTIDKKDSSKTAVIPIAKAKAKPKKVVEVVTPPKPVKPEAPVIPPPAPVIVTTPAAPRASAWLAKRRPAQSSIEARCPICPRGGDPRRCR